MLKAAKGMFFLSILMLAACPRESTETFVRKAIGNADTILSWAQPTYAANCSTGATIGVCIIYRRVESVRAATGIEMDRYCPMWRAGACVPQPLYESSARLLADELNRSAVQLRAAVDAMSYDPSGKTKVPDKQPW